MLSSEEYLAEVHEDITQAAELGANGVPFFVLDHKYGVPGAQPVEVFTQVLQRVLSEQAGATA